jgi:hypothetical protein
MKKIFVIISLVLFVGFSFVACDNGSGGEADHAGGFITITDIPSEYNGTEAEFTASNREHFISGDWTIIKNNKVKMPLFAYGEPYKKSETIITDPGVNVFGSTVSTANKWILLTIGTGRDETGYYALAKVKFPAVTFLDGNATLSWTDGIVNIER